MGHGCVVHAKFATSNMGHDRITDGIVCWRSTGKLGEVHLHACACRSGFMRSRHPMFGRNMTLLALQKPGAANYFSILRPNTGESFFDMEARPSETSLIK